MAETRRGVISSGAQGNPNATQFRDNHITTSRYTAYNFLFYNLRDQFRRLANFYFLMISVLMILGWYAPRLFQSSINPWGTLGTLIFVLGVTMVKDGSEDIARHRADKRENTALVIAIRNGKEVELEKQKLAVGDYVLVKSKEQFPADLIVLASSDSRGQCYVETSNIDGETNLKIRKVPKPFLDEGYTNKDNLPASGIFECDAPNKDIHNFSAMLQVGEKKISIGISNFLLRGSVLRNTQWVIGLVVYSGEDTKIMRNRGHAPSKLSTIERTVNRLIGIVFLSHFLLVVFSVILNGIFARQFPYAYLGDSQEFILPDWLGLCCTFYILYSNFIPISLYVTMEMVNLFQAKFINWDKDMYHEDEDVPALCLNSTLCQDLGQVEYIFSDKTGTLTRNLMEFKRASIGGQVYDTEEARRAVYDGNEQVVDFFRLLSMCHTVVPDPEGSRNNFGGVQCPSYEAESPDESALVEAAARVGIRFFDRTAETATAIEFGSSYSPEPTQRDGEHDNSGGEAEELDTSVASARTYTILAVNEFNSTRKRMSILVKDPNNKFVLLCKGADNVMFDLSVGSSEHTVLNQHLTRFAEEGLRTLVCSKRELSEAQGTEWLERYNQAQLAVNDRSQLLAEVAAEIETGMSIIGASAIEDKLQDEVPETLESLQQAGIKVWVLTGDKLETAVNIGYSCRLLNPSMRVMIMSTETKAQAAEELLRLENVLDIANDEQKMNRLRASMKKVKRRVLLGKKGQTKDHAEMDPLLEQVRQKIDAETAAERAAALQRVLGGGKGESNVAAVSPPPAEFATPDPDIERGDASQSTALEEVQPEMILTNKDESPESHLHDDKLSSPLDARTDHIALVVDGKTLNFIMNDPNLRKSLLHVGRVCKAVLACRVSPAQKAEIVSLVKDGVPGKPVTLAIGDGANDVTMIQRAALGIGIRGREGRQAVNAADFAIGQFRFLKKLVLVHGRYNYRRMSKVILLCFYKNICLVLSLFIFSVYTLMTGTSPFDSWVYAGFNWFSGMPPLLLGMFDKDISEDMLLAVPSFYATGLSYSELNIRKILQWIVRAILHSLLCALIPITLSTRGVLPDELGSLFALGTLIFACVLFTVNFIVALETQTWNGTHWFFHPGSALLFFLSVLFFSIFPSYHFMYGVAQQVFSSGMFWIVGVLLVPVTNVCINLLFKHLRREFRPELADIGAEADRGKGVLSRQSFKDLMAKRLVPNTMDTDNIETVIERTYSIDAEKVSHAHVVARQASATTLAPE